jgi:hypothetical protein
MDAADLVAERLACTRCIGDARLRADARAAGFEAECRYCARTGTCVDVAWLADRVHPALQAVFQPAAEACADDAAGSTHARCDGVAATSAAADLAAPLARDVHATLVALFHDADGSATYPADGAYVERPARGLPSLHRWTTFVLASARSGPAANGDLLDALKWLFGGFDALVTPKGRRAYRALDAGLRAYDVRLDSTHDAPDFGPLNGRGVPARYLALRERTAVTESLAPRGARVVLARLRLARHVRVLDLEAAQKVLARAGGFDPDRAGSRLRAQFLAEFADALRTTALRPSDDPVSQATRRVGDWLAHGASPRIDGMLTRAAHAPGRTLVLLAPAAATNAVVGERERRYTVDALRAQYRRVKAVAPRTLVPRTPPARD